MQADEQLVAAKAALQHELLALKSQHGDRFHLHRAHSGPDAPFPVIASLHVEKPPAAEAYDIFDNIQIRVTIQVSALSQVRSEAASGLTVEVRSSELPLRLREYIAQRLYSGWKLRHLGAASGDGGLQLGKLLEGAQEQYLELLTGLPGCSEAYESTSASGATLRRFVITQDSVADGRAASSPDHSTDDSVHQDHSLGSGTPVDPPTVHGLDRDVVWARRKYGALSCQLLPCVGGDDGEMGALMCLRLEIRPTDPAWTPQDGSLLLDFTVGSSYPAAGSLSVAVQPTSSCGVSEPGMKMLSRIWSAEASGLVSPAQIPSRAASSLKLLILSIENGAGEAARQVELAFARQNADAVKPSAEIGDAVVLPDGSSGNEEEGGKPWRHRVGAGLWWPCVAGSDAIAVRTTALPPMPEQSDASDSDSQSGSDSRTSLSGGDGAQSEGEEEDPRTRTDNQARLPAPGARTAVELHLDGLRVSNIDAMELHSLNLQVSCQRCGQAEAVRLAPGEATSRQPESRTEGDCSKCHANWAVVLQLRHVHDTCNVLGLLWPSGCSLQDLLPSILQVQCSSCSASGAIRQVMVGGTAERACSHCHSTLSVHFGGVNFVPRSSVPPRSRQLRRRRRNGSDGNSDSGVESAALADRGTCKHYKHSYRWLRFPCCGARFPCDLCHEEATDGHHMKWATQMICGFCSREQPLGTHCSFCHRRLSSGSGVATAGQSHFWEGGSGCRDKSRLDSRDSHKYTNSKLKTQSKRSERVGQRGKQLREQRQAANGD